MDVNVLLQRDGVGGGSLGGVADFGVDLGCGHVFVGQHRCRCRGSRDG